MAVFYCALQELADHLGTGEKLFSLCKTDLFWVSRKTVNNKELIISTQFFQQLVFKLLF